jgi:hypothetical protein
VTTVDVTISNEFGDQRRHLDDGLGGAASRVGIAVLSKVGSRSCRGSRFCERRPILDSHSDEQLAAAMRSLDLGGSLYSGSAGPVEVLTSLVPDGSYILSLLEF